MSRRAPARGRRGGSRAGFTLIETIIGIMITVVGILALVSVSAAMTHQMNQARQLTQATAMGRGRIERLQSVGCASLAGGTATSGGLTERWSVRSAAGSNPAADMRELRDSVFVRDRSRMRIYVYVSMRSCS